MMNENMQIRGFTWQLEVLEPDGTVKASETKKNLIPDEGLSHLIRAPFGDTSSIGAFYLGLYRGNFNPTQGVTAADIPINMNELVDYEEVARPLWDRAFTAPASFDNIASKAEFTITETRTVQGCFLVSSNIKGGNTGLLLSCVRFSSPKEVVKGDVVRVTGGLSYYSVPVI